MQTLIKKPTKIFSGTKRFIINKMPCWTDCCCDWFNIKGAKVTCHKMKSIFIKSCPFGVKSVFWWSYWGKNFTSGQSQSQVQFDSIDVNVKEKKKNLARRSAGELVTELSSFLKVLLIWKHNGKFTPVQ